MLLALPLRFCMLLTCAPPPSCVIITPLLIPAVSSTATVFAPVPCCVIAIELLSADDKVPMVTFTECAVPSCVITTILLSPI